MRTVSYFIGNTIWGETDIIDEEINPNQDNFNR